MFGVTSHCNSGSLGEHERDTALVLNLDFAFLMRWRRPGRDEQFAALHNMTVVLGAWGLMLNCFGSETSHWNHLENVVWYLAWGCAGADNMPYSKANYQAHLSELKPLCSFADQVLNPLTGDSFQIQPLNKCRGLFSGGSQSKCEITCKVLEHEGLWYPE